MSRVRAELRVIDYVVLKIYELTSQARTFKKYFEPSSTPSGVWLDAVFPSLEVGSCGARARRPARRRSVLPRASKVEEKGARIVGSLLQ